MRFFCMCAPNTQAQASGRLILSLPLFSHLFTLSLFPLPFEFSSSQTEIVSVPNKTHARHRLIAKSSFFSKPFALLCLVRFPSFVFFATPTVNGAVSSKGKHFAFQNAALSSSLFLSFFSRFLRFNNFAWHLPKQTTLRFQFACAATCFVFRNYTDPGRSSSFSASCRHPHLLVSPSLFGSSLIFIIRHRSSPLPPLVV